MTDNRIAYSTKEASKGGFQAIKKFEATLVEHERIKNKFAGEDGMLTDDAGNKRVAPDQIEARYEDVVILEMEEGEPEVELKDNKFTVLYSYAKPEKQNAHQNTFWMKGYVASAEALGKTPKEFEGTRVVMEQQEVLLFTRKDKDTGEKTEVLSTNFVFVNPSEGGTSENVADRVKKLVVGKNKTAALRAIMQDNLVKRHPEYRTAVTNGTVGELIEGIELVDDIFVDVLASEPEKLEKAEGMQEV